jgi:hypothetical protein
MLGLPEGAHAGLFAIDGALTKTAVHAKAWTEKFDQYLKQRAECSGAGSSPSTAQSDYVDCVPRDDGVRPFLKPDSYPHPRRARIGQIGGW